MNRLCILIKLTKLLFINGIYCDKCDKCDREQAFDFLQIKKFLIYCNASVICCRTIGLPNKRNYIGLCWIYHWINIVDLNGHLSIFA